MSRGLPDYYNPSSQVSQRMVDLAGVLAAVAKIPPLDGRGRLVYVDTFGEGISTWGLLNAGDGVAPVLYAGLSEIPPACVRLVTGTAGGGGSSTFRRKVQVSIPTRCGLEVGVYIAHVASYIQVQLGYVDGALFYTGELRLNALTGDLAISTPAGYQTIGAVDADGLQDSWYALKVVIDYVSHTYVRIIAGQTQIDIDGIAVSSVAGTRPGWLLTTIVGLANGAVSATHYLGHVALTLDEP